VKKAAATILLLIYFVASTGATIHIHYCMGELKSWKLWHAKEEKKKGCSTCGMEKKNGCCEDKQIVIRVDKKHNLSYPSYQVIPPPTLYLGPVTVLCNGVSPPRISLVPLFVKNCVYRI
jgi:hypothetical protein